MNRLLTLLIAGAFCASVFATEGTPEKGAPEFSGKDQSASERQAAIAKYGSEVADSIKARIHEYQTEIENLKSDISMQRDSFQAQIKAMREARAADMKELTSRVPDSARARIEDSLKVKISDSVKTMIHERRAAAKEDLNKALEKVDEVQKAKFEKALSQLEKKLADRQLKAEEAKAKLEAKKAEIIEKIKKADEKAADTEPVTE